MKKLIVLLLLFTGIATYAQENNEWDEWQKTSCYSKVFYRIKSEKKNGEQFRWKIQFRSEYAQAISFNYHVTDKLDEYNPTSHRKTLGAKQFSEEIEVYTTIDDIYLIVDKLSLSPYPENFESCDN